jgi:hypothetical protein
VDGKIFTQSCVNRVVVSDSSMISSSRFLKYVGQYFFLVLGIAWTSNSIFNISLRLYSGELSENEIILNAIAGLFGFGCILLFFYLKDKFVVVELGSQTIKIQKGRESINTSWLNVESVERLSFSTPPIYVLRLNDNDRYFLFWNSSLNLLWTDDSEMGDMIRKKKKQLDI